MSKGTGKWMRGCVEENFAVLLGRTGAFSRDEFHADAFINVLFVALIFKLRRSLTALFKIYLQNEIVRRRNGFLSSPLLRDTNQHLIPFLTSASFQNPSTADCFSAAHEFVSGQSANLMDRPSSFVPRSYRSMHHVTRQRVAGIRCDSWRRRSFD